MTSSNIMIFRKTQLNFLSSFALLILAGALILWSPLVKCKGGISFLDALFTSTSAVCVTGLSVTDTANFDLAGQLVILALIQLGGLGIMTITTAMLLFISGELGFIQKVSVTSVTSVFSMKEVDNILKTIITYTLVIEFTGFCILFVAFSFSDSDLSNAAYNAMFHSISAFNNAGFSTYTDSLCNANALVKFIIALLIIAGGFGYYVVLDLMKWYRTTDGKIKVHTKIVLMMTFILVFGGTVAIWLLEAGKIRLGDAFFQSVTTRTAGFNSVDLTLMSGSSILIMMLLMVIGASPGSTAGGIKNTTAALAAITMYNTFKGKKDVLLFERHIPTENIMKAFAIIMSYFLTAFVATVAMMVFEKADMTNASFEVISALSTVGLSLGLSMKCGAAGKIILIACMFIGRVGPMALLFFLVSRKSETKLSYPAEEIILG